MDTILGLITARGGSRGIPRKAIVPVAGKPLIVWTIDSARGSCVLSRVIVSTDDQEIADISRDNGVEVPFLRPSKLAQDQADHISVVMHALDWLQQQEGYAPDYVMLLQPTSPLRSAQDIDAAIQLARKHSAKAVVSVTEACCHPYLTKRINPNGTLTDFYTADISYMRRQDLPPAYALNGAIYLNATESLRQDKTFTPSGTYPYIMPPERSVDIDTPWDLHLASLILGAQHEPFNQDR